MKRLYIGRFQPFHYGHLHLIEHIIKTTSTLLIGIGSAQYSHTLQNPFTYQERNIMIQKSLNERNITCFQIYSIPDIHNPPAWVDHVTQLVPDFDEIISNSSFTLSLFKEKGYQIKKTPLFNRTEYKGSYIRRCIIEKKPWSHLVPKSVFDYIQEINGVSRLLRLAAQNH